MFFRKVFLPWTIPEAFDSDDAYRACLQKREKQFQNLRMLFLVLAAICLIAGYAFNNRPVMVSSVLPLALVIPLTMALEQLEKALK